MGRQQGNMTGYTKVGHVFAVRDGKDDKRLVEHALTEAHIAVGKHLDAQGHRVRTEVNEKPYWLEISIRLVEADEDGGV